MAALVTEKFELRIAAARASLGGADVISSVQEARSGLFVCKLDTQAIGNFVKLQAGTQADGSDMADVANSKCQALADGQLIGVEFVDSPYPYHRSVVIRGTNTAVGDCYFINTDPAGRPRNNFNDGVSSTRIRALPTGLALGTP